MSARFASRRKSSKTTSLSHRRLLDGERLPAIEIDGRRIADYAVIAREQDMDKAGKYAVLSWTPEDYDFEEQRKPIPKLYIFRSEKSRNEMQQQLYDEQPRFYLQAFKLSTPIRIRPSPPIPRQ